jgi:hypothetical protein
MAVDPQIGTINIEGVFIQETQGNAGEIIPYAGVNSGAYGDLTDFGEFDELMPILPDMTGWDFTSSDGGWTIVWGSYSPGTGILPHCFPGGGEYVDAYKDLGAPQTLSRITITYNATYAGGATNLNKVYVRPSPSAAWQEISRWTTSSGSGLQKIIDVPNLVASAIRAVIYAGGSSCAGDVTITDISVNSLGLAVWSHTFDFTVSDQGWVAVVKAGYTFGHYSAGVGWVSDYVINDGTDLQAVNITFDIGQTVHLTKMEMHYSVTLPGTALDFPDGALNAGTDIDHVAQLASDTVSSGPGLILGANFSADYSFLYVNAQAAVRIPTNGTDPGGQNVITSVVVAGTGVDPF